MKSSEIPIFPFIVTLSLAVPAGATTFFWDGTSSTGDADGGSGNWDTTLANWDTSALAGTDTAWPTVTTLDDDAVFGGIAGTVTVDAGGVAANSLAFNTANYIIQGGKITLNGTSPTITSTVAATINSELGGSASLTKTGAGVLTLGTANTYTGGTVISGSAGVVNALRISHSNALGSSGLTIGSGGNTDQARLELTGGITVANAVAAMTSRNNFVPSILNVSGNNTMSANLSSGGGGARITFQSNSDRLTLSGSVGVRNPFFTGSGDILVSGNITSPIGYRSLTKEGTGTLILSGASNVTDSLTTITAGVLQIGNAGTTGTLGSAPVTNNATLVFNRSDSFSVSNTISGSGKLTKQGAGTLTLGGPNSYTGVTTISAGSISIASLGDGGAPGNLGAATSAASNIVFGGGALQFSAASAATSNRGFTINAGSSATFNVSDPAGELALAGSVPTTTGVLFKTGVGLLTLDPGAVSQSVGAISANGGSLVLKSGTYATTAKDSSAGLSAYNIGAGARGGTLTIDGATLNVGGGSNLKIAATASGSLSIKSGTVTSSEIVIGHNGVGTAAQSGGTVTVTNLYHQDGGAGNSYTLSGGSLTARRIYNNTATAVDFTLNLNGGTLKSASGTTNLIDNQNTGTQISVLLGSGNTIIDTSASNATIVRPMGDMPSVAGTFTKAGANSLTLTASNTYTGGTTITAGTLLANNTTGSATGTGAVVVNGGTLGGTGSISGATTINTTGVLSPGASVGTLGTGALNLKSGSELLYELNTTGTTGDLLNVNGNLDFTGTVTLNLQDLGSSTALATGTKFTLISYFGTWDGDTFNGYADDSTFTLFNNEWMIRYDDTSSGAVNGGAFTNAVTLTVIPEPGAALLGGIGLLVLIRRRR